MIIPAAELSMQTTDDLQFMFLFSPVAVTWLHWPAPSRAEQSMRYRRSSTAAANANRPDNQTFRIQ